MIDLLRIPLRNLLCISLRNLCIPLRILWECKVSLLSKSRHILFLLDQLCCDWAGCPLHLRGELPRRKSYHLPRVNISATAFPKCFCKSYLIQFLAKKLLVVLKNPISGKKVTILRFFAPLQGVYLLYVCLLL